MYYKAVVKEGNYRTSITFPLKHRLCIKYSEYDYKGDNSFIYESEDLGDIFKRVWDIVQVYYQKFPNRNIFELWSCKAQGVVKRPFMPLIFYDSSFKEIEKAKNYLTTGNVEYIDSYGGADPDVKIARNGVLLVDQIASGCVRYHNFDKIL